MGTRPLAQRLKRIVSLASLRRVPGRISQWMPNTAQGLTVLSVDGRWLKLLRVSGWQSARKITALLAHPIDGMSDDQVLDWLKQACAARQLEPGPILIANPSHLTTTRLFSLPSTDPVEIRDIVELQAEKHTPYAKEEILTDFRIVDTDRVGYSRVLLILSHQDVVYRALKLVEGLGWPLERVGFELEGLIAWAQGAVPAASTQPVLVVELDRETATLVILQRHQLYFHRSLTMGAAHLLSDPDAGIAKLITEFRRSLEAFESEGLNLTISGLIVTGLARRVSHLQERLQQELTLPTTVIPPFDRCEFTDPAIAEQESITQVSFTSLVGLTLGPSVVDLTPKALKLHRTFEDRAKVLVGLGCQVMAVLLLVCCVIMGKANTDERYHARLLHEYDVSSQRTQQLHTLTEQLALVKQWLHHRSTLLDAIAEFSRQSPEAIRWDSLTFAQGDQVVLRGVSEEMPKVFDFAAALKPFPLCAAVETKRVTKKASEQEGTRFELICSLGAPAS